MNLSDLLVIGDVYIITQSPPDNKLDEKPDVPNVAQTVKDITSFKNKLKNDVTRVVQPGSIKRPNVGELLAKDEPPIKKETDNALRETLDKIPELQEAKEYLAQQRK